MIVINGLSEIEYSGYTRVVIGKFDGVHAGHAKLIRTITEKDDDLRSVVFTFSYNSSVLNIKSGRLLSAKERRDRFESLGVDYLVEYTLDENASKMEPEDFAREILKKRLHCKELVCGNDLSFGYMGRGNIDLLRSMEDELSITVTVIDKVQYLGEDISSSRIREAIKEGKTEEAENMLRG